MANQRVALTQNPLHVKPHSVKLLFHVEHAPIKKLPAALGPPLEQVKGIRVYELNRKATRQLSRILNRSSLNPPLELTVSPPGNPDRQRGRVLRVAHQGMNDTTTRLMVDNGLKPAASEGAPRAQQVYRLQNARLPTTVGPCEYIHPRKIELCVVNIPKLLDPEAPKRHA